MTILNLSERGVNPPRNQNLVALIYTYNLTKDGAKHSAWGGGRDMKEWQSTPEEMSLSELMKPLDSDLGYESQRGQW